MEAVSGGGEDGEAGVAEGHCWVAGGLVRGGLVMWGGGGGGRVGWGSGLRGDVGGLRLPRLSGVWERTWGGCTEVDKLWIGNNELDRIE